MGGGHLSRCLTLANKLKALTNADCLFVMRNHNGNGQKQVLDAGFEAALLPLDFEPDYFCGDYAQWIGTSERNDAEDTRQAIQAWQPAKIDLLVVDHYGLSLVWERHVKAVTSKLFVIDDLVNRNHCGDFLLDQTCGRRPEEYHDLTPDGMRFFTGEKYCLLRDEFFQFREAALPRRSECTKPRRLVMNFGSTDPHNHTGQLLTLVETIALKFDLMLSVIVGKHCPHLATIKQQCQRMAVPCELLIDCQHVAQVLASSDIAIGAAGASTWERCMLGLPTLLIQTASNQSEVIHRVTQRGAAISMSDNLTAEQLEEALRLLFDNYSEYSEAAAALVDGSGLAEIVAAVC